MTTGVIDRFRTLPIASGAVLTGHVTASAARNGLLHQLFVIAVALIAGLRPEADSLRWLVQAPRSGFADARDSVGRRRVRAARQDRRRRYNAMTFVAAFAPYVPSAFVLGGQHARRPELLVAEHQPVTPIADSVRALLKGTPKPGRPSWIAFAWCAVDRAERAACRPPLRGQS